ncbi:MAG: CaiB/BaiF CoA-transferase family protein [Chloroflexota bacterium]|nr:CaiB/BaiF CoA-transferase family protein [Chloroflexota bacterium]
MSAALDGIKILDLSRLAPGPYCTMILGDLGAEVIRVDPGGGKAAEAIFPMPPELEEKIRAYDAESRNKKSIVLNLKVDGARDIVYRLVEKVDVFVEGFRAGVTKRLGVDYETLKEKNPRLVYCSVTGYGQTGPYRELVGHDINYLSIGGALDIIRDKNEWPVPPSNLVADYASGGMQAAIGILAALMARERTGKGQHVDIAMTDGVISLCHTAASQHFQGGLIPGLEGMDMATITSGRIPHYGIYETKDGKMISIGALEPRFYQNLCHALGRDDLAMMEWSIDRWPDVSAAFAEAFRTKTRDEWFDLLRQTDTCASPVYSLEEVFVDPHVVDRQMVVEVDHPKVGKVKQIGVSIKLSETPGEIRRLAPAPGEHTEEILQELGYSSEQITKLRESGAFG